MHGRCNDEGEIKMSEEQLESIKESLEVAISNLSLASQQLAELDMFGSQDEINICIETLDNELFEIKGLIEKESK